MKAMVLYGDYDVRYEEVPTPEPGYGQVLVRVNRAGICATDIAIYTGNNSFKEKGLIRYPMIQGHEWSGRVEKTGDGVDDISVGDRVIGDSVVSCGHCRECLAGRYVQCEHQRSVGTVNAWNGAFADFIVMPQRAVYRVPREVTDEEAALVEPLSIGVYAVERAGVAFGDTVVVFGTGAIGFGALVGAVNSAAFRTILVGRRKSKLGIGKAFGASNCIDSSRQNAAEEIMRLTDGKGADVVVEATGSEDVLRTCLSVTKSSGALAIPAFYDRDLSGFPMDDLVLRNIKAVGVSAAPNVPGRVLGLLAEKKFPVSSLITRTFDLEKLPEAYGEAVNNRENIRIILKNL